MSVMRKGPAVMAALFILGLLSVLQAHAGQRFYFVQITDTHLGIPVNNERTRVVIDAVNALPMTVECVVHTGDIYDRRVRKNAKAAVRAREMFKRLKVPVYFIPGNNEINLSRPSGTEDRYLRQFGPLSYSKRIRDVLFVFIYSDPLRTGLALKGFSPFEALTEELEKAGTGPLILFHHCPSVDDFYENATHPGWPGDVRDRWVDIINSHNVRGVITGHFHRDELHWLGKVPLFIAGPVAAKYGRQAAFRVYEYDGGQLSYTTQYQE